MQMLEEVQVLQAMLWYVNTLLARVRVGDECLTLLAEHACICHTCSTLHCRYYDKKDLERLKEGAAAVDKLSVDSEEIANARLAAAQDREGNGALEKQQILQFWKESGRSGLIWPEPPVAEPVANLLRSSRVVGRSRKRRTHDAFKR